MESTWRICVCLYCCLPWLSAGTQCSPHSRGGSEEPPEFLAAPGGAVLPGAAAPGVPPPLLEALRSRGWRSAAPRLQPDSRALRYMKRLYRLSATSEGIPRARRGRLYNTARLFTPCWECEPGHPGSGDVHSVDLLFNLDRVTTLE
ncbi:GDF9 factor, partial [Erithacus rubecula]|nr:GDF9 factor [Erithacus rubecula]